MSFTRNLIFSITLTTSAAICFGKDDDNFSWSVFTYNSPEEKAFWDKLPDWSSKGLRLITVRFKRNARGEIIDSNSSEGFNGYVRGKSLFDRTIYQFVDGYVVRSKTLNKGGKKKLEIKNKAGRYVEVDSGKDAIIEERRSKDGRVEYVAVVESTKVDWVWTDWHETVWYDNGQKKEESAHKDGKLFSLERWKANGEKYPETNLKDGNGFVVNYHENGKKKEISSLIKRMDLIKVYKTTHRDVDMKRGREQKDFQGTKGFIKSSPNVHQMFTKCSPNVHREFTKSYYWYVLILISLLCRPSHTEGHLGHSGHLSLLAK